MLCRGIKPKGGAFSTRLSFGANRYYGRNLFSYRLYDSILAATAQLNRADLNSPWVESATSANSSFKFNKLEIPYSDELTIALSQNIGFVGVNAKFINREGRDEIMQRQKRANDTTLPSIEGYTNTYYYYTNEGKSSSDIVSVSVENIEPLQTLNIGHYFLLAFDRTLTNRSYNEFASNESTADDPDILYDGKIIKYSERPTENYARPWTLRLNTTQTMKMGWVRLLWNNFFRYRSGYDRMVLLNRNSEGWNAVIGNSMSQYGKYHFKGVFNWDMRVGLEFKMANAGTLYTNVDIINVLNQKNMTTIGGNAGNMSAGTILSSSVAIPVYDIGRQFWLQFGYKY